MLIWCKGNLFDSQCETYVNAVNTQGPMGRGIAAEFKLRYPDYYTDYHMWLCEYAPSGGDIRYYQCRPPLPLHGSSIISAATKELWRNPSRMEYVEKALEKMADCIRIHRIPSIAIPALGCGMGGLDWDEVRPLLEAFAEKLPHVIVEIYEPWQTAPK